jgi:hypothetical protein
MVGMLPNPAVNRTLRDKAAQRRLPLRQRMRQCCPVTFRTYPARVGRNTQGCKNLCEVTNGHCAAWWYYIRCNALRLLHPTQPENPDALRAKETYEPKRPELNCFAIDKKHEYCGKH